MGYYALLVPNTGLAKAGAAAWWSQGFTYLWNFAAPYALWLPLLLAAPFVLLPALRWWRRDDRLGVVVLVTPVVVALADILYVVHVGGDYMHARLLLPGFFALCLPDLRVDPPGPKRLDRASDRNPGVGRDLCRVAPLRPPKSDRLQSPDRVHLQRAQQLDQRNRQSTPDYGNGLPQGSLRERRRGRSTDWRIVYPPVTSSFSLSPIPTHRSTGREPDRPDRDCHSRWLSTCLPSG